MKRYSNYKESGIEWIGEIPVYWGVMQLGFIADIQNGYAFSSDDFDFNFAVPVIRIGDIKEVIDLKHATKVKKETYDKTTEFSARKNDILIAMTGATIGKSTEYLTNDLALINQRVGAIRARNIVNKRFLTYLINSSIFRLNIEFECYGGAQENISKDQLNRFKFPLPPLPEQQLITNFLDRKTSQIDDLIKKKEELVRLLELKRQAVINEAVTKGLNPKAKMKDSGVDWIGEVPEHWSIYKGSRIGDFYKGSGVKKDEVKSEGVACIRYGEIYTTYNKWFNKTKSFIDPALAKVSFSIQKGDLLFAASGETKEDIGKCVTYLGTQYAVAGGDIIILRPNNLVDSFYASFLMNSDSINIQKSLLSKGEIIVHLYAKHLRAISYPIPPTEEQAELYNYLNVFSSRVDNIKKSIIQQVESLVEYKKSLIFEVVTGKRVV